MTSSEQRRRVLAKKQRDSQTEDQKLHQNSAACPFGARTLREHPHDGYYDYSF